MTDPITSHTAIHTTAIHITADTATGPVIDRTRNRSSSVLLAVAVAWVASVLAIAAEDGFVAAEGRAPWPTVVAVVIPVAIFGAGLRNPSIRRAILTVDARIWLALQLWRVVGAAFLFGWAEGDLDAGFAIPAGVGDIATGLAALWLLSRIMVDAGHTNRRWNNRHVVAFTALGVGDFAVAVMTGVLLRPEGLETLPWILFPTLAVPYFLIVHIVNWMQLRQRPRSR